jgi:hypothetical protein
MHFQTAAKFSMEEKYVILEINRYPVSLHSYDPDYSIQPAGDV